MLKKDTVDIGRLAIVEDQYGGVYLQSMLLADPMTIVSHDQCKVCKSAIQSQLSPGHRIVRMYQIEKPREERS